ncbi:MAG: NAD(+) synthase [Eggerthellaceae bacterium]|nr:NAD(+) synthase [Eggerthellaceae bacterium]
MKNYMGDLALIDYAKAEALYKRCVTKTRDFIYGLGAKDVVIGLSGGIDSALACAIAVDAFGPKHVHAVLIPGPYSTKHSIQDAKSSAEALGINHKIVNIKDIYEGFKDVLEQPCGEEAFAGLTSQNIQARIRMTVLMAFANAKGWLLLSTSNKTEFYLGYFTLYGDLSGVFGPIGGLVKHEVYGLALWRNVQACAKDQAVALPIPENSLLKPPSAELADMQTDQDSLGLDYETLDKMVLIYERAILVGKSCSEIAEELQAAGFHESKVTKVLSLIETNKFKQHLTPPHP